METTNGCSPNTTGPGLKLVSSSDAPTTSSARSAGFDTQRTRESREPCGYIASVPAFSRNSEMLDDRDRRARRTASKTLLVLSLLVWVAVVAMISHDGVPRTVVVLAAYIGFALSLIRIAFFAND